MKVLIDCLHLRNKQTGVETYSVNLLTQIAKNSGQNDSFVILIDRRYVKYDLTNIFKGENKKIRVIKLFSFYYIQFIYSGLLVPFFLRWGKFDVYHNHYFFGPYFKFISPKTKVYITVHDLFYLNDYAVAFKKGLSDFYLSHLATPAYRNADLLLVLSSYVKEEIVKTLEIDSNKIKVILPGQTLKTNELRDKTNLFDVTTLDKQEYFLFVGTILPRKGIGDLLTAYYKSFLIDKNIPCLLLVGKYTSYINNLSNWLKEVNNDDFRKKINFVGYVDDFKLVNYYSAAKALILPSYAEGFGFPALEAMALSCPLIARKGSSLTEVVGDGGLLFESIDELSSFLVQISSNSDLRKELIIKGLMQSSLFTWERTALETLGIYRN